MAIDLRRALEGYRASAGRFDMLTLPPRRYLAIDGHGDPNSPVLEAATAALYPVAYRAKFLSKAAGFDYVVPPLEGLWWASDMASFTAARDKAEWDWRLLLLVPDEVDDALVDEAIERVRTPSRRSATVPARLDDVRLERLEEGRCVQTLHVGSFDDEAAVLRTMHESWIPAHGLRMTGTHHEIYLSDARRVPQERRRTILRQPVTDV